jgi:hypothetical protein
MSESVDDRLAAAIAHDSAIARAVSACAATIARAWATSAVRRWWDRGQAAFSALSADERRRCGFVALAAAVVTHLLFLVL